MKTFCLAAVAIGATSAADAADRKATCAAHAGNAALHGCDPFCGYEAVQAGDETPPGIEHLDRRQGPGPALKSDFGHGVDLTDHVGAMRKAHKPHFFVQEIVKIFGIKVTSLRIDLPFAHFDAPLRQTTPRA